MKIVGSAPLSNKVSNGTVIGMASGVIAAALQYFIPAWHSGIPQIAQLLITAGIGATGYFGGGWMSKHQATVSEIEIAIRDAEAILSLPKSPSVINLGPSLVRTSAPGGTYTFSDQPAPVKDQPQA
jgi:hypothetical protein